MASRGRGQRIFIWVLAGIMAVGTMGSFFLIIVANENDQREAAVQQEQFEEQQRLLELDPEPLDGYEATAFDAAKVTELKTEDLVTGNGKEVSVDSTVTVNYFGWLADGTIFDSSKRGGELDPATFPLNQVIPGWIEGLDGAKEGTVRKLTIPAELAYGAAERDVIPANSPLVFIVEVIKVES